MSDNLLRSRQPARTRLFDYIGDYTQQATSHATSINGHGSHGLQQFRASSPIQSEQMQETFLLPAVETPPAQRSRSGVNDRNRAWNPGTFGFDDDYDVPSFEKEETFSMLVLR